MLSQKKTRKYLKNSIDIALLVIAFWAGAILARSHAGIAPSLHRPGARDLLLVLLLCLGWNFSAKMFFLYDEFRNHSLSVEIAALLKAVLLQAALTVYVLFLVKSPSYSRFFFFIHIGLLLAVLILARVFLDRFFAWRQGKGRHLNQVLIVGGSRLATAFARVVAGHRHLGLRLKGFIADDSRPEMESLHLGSLKQLADVLEREAVDEVIIALPHSDADAIRQVIAVCENYPVQVSIIPEFFQFTRSRFRISRLGPFPLVSIHAIPLEQFQWRLIKRGFDLLATVAAFALLFSWLWPLLALLIKATSPGPVFFKQERWGERNNRIRCFKFRSMVRESLDVDEAGRYQQAKPGDPRVTRLGRFLRHSNLDELPQFINVLKGEMSLVGPRPHPTPMNLEAKDTIRRYQARHRIKPGITGWAQVNGLRGQTEDPQLLQKRVEADLWYIENWSLWLDLKIIWLTAWRLLKGDPHAY
ncbi:MAG: undecaprenyl-phosphate glucose phosphotransferase [Candidatus Aminicenantes bacterium]|nr:undecaprenyl-phosphate glucose phosphotransferase [Candidatus Aminicenantes bacterium]